MTGPVLSVGEHKSQLDRAAHEGCGEATYNELDRLKREIARLRRNKRGVRLRPHKLVLLLAVLDMAEDGLLEHNRIPFGDELISRFELIFERYRRANDLCQPAPAFFHLRTAPFWQLRVKTGKETMYASLRTSGGGSKRLLDTVEYAFLSEYALRLIEEDKARSALRAFIERVLDREAQER